MLAGPGSGSLESLLPLPASGGHWQSLPLNYGHVTPVSALLHTEIFLCVALSRVLALSKGQQLLGWVSPSSDVTSFYPDCIFK